MSKTIQQVEVNFNSTLDIVSAITLMVEEDNKLLRAEYADLVLEGLKELEVTKESNDK